MAATRYPQEFRQQAIELARLGGQPITRIAADLGISDQTLRNWVKQADIDAGRRDGLTSDERAEVVRLRRRNRVLEMEVEILKRASAFFARENVGGIYEKQSDGTETKYYDAGGATAMRQVPPGGGAGTVYYLLADHLGGTTKVLNASGSVVSEQKYWPYGAVRSGGITQTDKLFTGQQDEPGDSALGLYNYNARFYSTTLGRFVSADPIVGSAYDPQSWNPYAYVRNNPLAYVDPTGMYFEEPGDSTPAAQQGNFCGRECRTQRATLQFLQAMGDPAKRQAFIDWVTPKPAALPDAGAGVGEKEVPCYLCVPIPQFDVDPYEVDSAIEAGWSNFTSNWSDVGYAIGSWFNAEGDSPVPDEQVAPLPPHPPTASELAREADENGWTRTQSPGGPIQYVDENGVIRVTLKRGSARTPGSEGPHAEFRGPDGGRVDAQGTPVTKRSPGNHTPIQWDLP